MSHVNVPEFSSLLRLTSREFSAWETKHRHFVEKNVMALEGGKSLPFLPPTVILQGKRFLQLVCFKGREDKVKSKVRRLIELYEEEKLSSIGSMPLTVLSFAARNDAFLDRLEHLQVSVLRTVNIDDIAPKIPGLFLNETFFGMFALRSSTKCDPVAR